MDKIKNTYQKYREIFRYFFFGTFSTVVNWVVYAIMVSGLSASIVVGNIVAWVVSVACAFVTNKVWVFESKTWRPSIVFKEATSFVGSRIVSGLLFDVGAPVLLVRIGLDQTLFGVKGFFAKIVAGIGTIVSNYVLGKFFVFRQST